MMLSADRRAHAERFLPQNLRPKVFNPQPRPHWIGTTDRFWYRHESADGISFTVVDAATGFSAPAFDHVRLATALGVDAKRLPIDSLDLVDPARIGVVVQGRSYVFATATGDLIERTVPPVRSGEAASPDGAMAAFCRDHDLWLRDRTTGDERRLTSGGAAHHAWAKSPDSNLTTVTLARRGISLPANVLWSPDGTKLFTSRLDERQVLDLPLVQHVPDDGSRRPVLHNMKFALSGDEHLPVESHCVIEIATGRIVVCNAGPHVTGMTTAIEKEEVWWSADSSRIFFLDRDRLWRRLTLFEMDAATGAAREVYTETASTFIDNNLSVLGLPNVRVLEGSGEFIWYSQRDGWGHLYLHDLGTGAMKQQITHGDWVVRDLLHVDAVARTIEFLAAGMDPAVNPYHRALCRVGFEGGDVQVLTPGTADHQLAIPLKRVPRDHIRPPHDVGAYRSPSGRYFVHTEADLVSLPVTHLRRADGGLVSTIATAELAPEIANSWRWPTPFTVLADDGKTVLPGAMWLPGDFDPKKKYPVIDYIYPGPQRGQLPTVMFTDFMPEFGRSALPQAFAELGFVVINVDARGSTPLRHKAFHDYSYGKLQEPGPICDHVAALRQLAERHPWLDLGRVGIMGHSGGGYASVHAMLHYPDHFHAAVATSGNHDQMGYSFAWTEKYQGPVTRNPDGSTNYSRAANPPFAANLRGKLLLATGDMDDNVHPALTHQLVAALIAADKDFDFIPLPNDDHTTVWSKPYFLRRAMEFMVRHLGAG